MKAYKLYLGLALIVGSLSCNQHRTGNPVHKAANDTGAKEVKEVTYDEPRKSLKLSVADTIKRSAEYYFSNARTKDQFILKISPGLVKNTKAELQIITTDGKIIYSQVFDAYYFVTFIAEPDSIPKTVAENDREAYLENYWKTLTPAQYEVYFRKSIDSFFTSISHLNRGDDLDKIRDWSDTIDQAFLREVIADPSIRLIDVPCYDCYEGGTVMGYSPKRNKVAMLAEHD